MTVLTENEFDPNETEKILPFDYEQTAEAVLSEFLDVTECPYESAVSILLTGADEIREINRQQRQIDRVTDVLSFPLHEYAVPAGYDELDEAGYDDFDPDSGELMLGDIVLCVPKIKEQACVYGHSTKREFAFLIAHSLLHLVGYDHMTLEDEERMSAIQNRILDNLGITRGGETHENT